MRSLIVFDCASDRLVATLDAAPGTTGVLIVSGGNEVRTGPHRGMAALAQRFAALGISVFRFDRRGVGDSSGENRGWAASGPDLEAAAAAFRRAQPLLTRVVGFGNCDAATALALFGREAGLDALILTNPWLGSDDPLPPPAALRRHYLRRIASPRSWRIPDVRKLAAGLRRSLSRTPAEPLAAQVAAGIAALPTTIILARADRTAQQFAAALPAVGTVSIETASHSFADAAPALDAAIRSALTM